MDKRTATLALTGKIREFYRPQAVINSTHQANLIKNSLAYCQVGNATRIEASYMDKAYNETSFDRKAEPGANYLFVEHNEYERYAVVSSFAIIGEEESNLLRNMLYKDVQQNLILAMGSLGIENYLSLYEKYSDNSLENLLDDYSFYLKLKNSLSDLFYARSPCSNSEFEKYFGEKVSKINKKLEGMPISGVSGWGEGGVFKSAVQEVVSGIERSPVLGKVLGMLPEFLNFVFTIKYEDQDIMMNKKILGSFSERLDYTGIMLREYSSGKYFEEYWPCLGPKKQAKVISSIKGVKERRLDHDSFLWAQGFKDVTLDHLNLYKDDARNFIEYFCNRASIEDKKTIIRDIMNCDFTNEEVIKWLNDNETDLVREVGLNG